VAAASLVVTSVREADGVVRGRLFLFPRLASWSTCCLVASARYLAGIVTLELGGEQRNVVFASLRGEGHAVVWNVSRSYGFPGLTAIRDLGLCRTMTSRGHRSSMWSASSLALNPPRALFFWYSVYLWWSDHVLFGLFLFDVFHSFRVLGGSLSISVWYSLGVAPGV